MTPAEKTRESREEVLEVVRYRMFCLLRDGSSIEDMRTTYAEIERLLDALSHS